MSSGISRRVGRDCTGPGLLELNVQAAALIVRLLHSELGLCSRRALCLHLQLDLGDLEAPALDAELQLIAHELSVGDGKAGVTVLVEQRRAPAIAPVSVPAVVVTPVGPPMLFEGKPARIEGMQWAMYVAGISS